MRNCIALSLLAICCITNAWAAKSEAKEYGPDAAAIKECKDLTSTAEKNEPDLYSEDLTSDWDAKIRARLKQNGLQQ